MHHYCVGKCKTPAALNELTERLVCFLKDWLIFEPDEYCLQLDHSSGFFVFGVSIGSSDYNISSRYHFDDLSWTVVGGFPTFEKYDDCPPGPSMAIAKWTHDICARTSPEALYETLGLGGGGWSVAEVHLQRGCITAFGGPSALCGLFYIDNDSFFAVGNKPSILGALQDSGPYSSIDKQFLLWQVALASVVGYRTMWEQVTRIRAGDYLEFQSQGDRSVLKIETFPNSPHRPLTITPSIEPELVEKGGHEIVTSMKWLLDCGFPIVSDLTGGKDSRLILAMLLGAGLADRIDCFETRGHPDHGDRMVAEWLAEKSGLKNFRAHEPAELSLADTLEAHLPRFAQTTPHYDFFCSAWDAELPSSLQRFVSRQRFIGHCGELYRQVVPARSPSGCYSLDDFINWRAKFNELGIVLPEVCEAFQTEIKHDIYERYQSEGTVNFAVRGFTDNQNGVWDNARGTNNPQRFTPLASLTLMRIANSKPNAYESAHYALMKQFAPNVLDVPFLNQTWNGPDRDRALQDGHLQEPLILPAKRQAPWQFKVFERHGRELMAEILDGFSVWDGLVSQKMMRKYHDNVPPSEFKKLNVLRMYNLYSATVLLTGHAQGRKWPHFRRYASRENPISVLGNSWTTLGIYAGADASDQPQACSI